MNWVTKEIAQTWPHGSVVLIHRPRHEAHTNLAYQVCSWFRPDWLDGYPYELGDETLYCLLHQN
jgi:hypothetical protein